MRRPWARNRQIREPGSGSAACPRPGSVSCSTALVRTTNKTYLMYLPVGRPIEPGKSITGRALVPLPLKAWHNFGTVAPLASPISAAVLEIAYVADPGPDGWDEHVLEGGAKVNVPKPLVYGKHKLLRTAAKPIPK